MFFPRKTSSPMTVSISSNDGTFLTVHGSSVKRVAIRIGRAEFLAPEIVIFPLRERPPSIVNKSKQDSLLGADNPRMTCQIANHGCVLPDFVGRKHFQDFTALVIADFQ